MKCILFLAEEIGYIKQGKIIFKNRIGEDRIFFFRDKLTQFNNVVQLKTIKKLHECEFIVFNKIYTFELFSQFDNERLDVRKGNT